MPQSKSVLTARLELYLEAETKVLHGQSYTIGSRQLTRANLGEIQKMIKELQDEIDALDGRSPAFSKRVVFMG